MRKRLFRSYFFDFVESNNMEDRVPTVAVSDVLHAPGFEIREHNQYRFGLLESKTCLIKQDLLNRAAMVLQSRDH